MKVLKNHYYLCRYGHLAEIVQVLSFSSVTGRPEIKILFDSDKVNNSTGQIVSHYLESFDSAREISKDMLLIERMKLEKEMKK